MPKSTEKTTPPAADAEPAAQPLPEAIETTAEEPARIGLAARVAAAAEAAISDREDAGAALHALDQRMRELLLVLPAALDWSFGDLRDDLMALRDLLI